MIRRGFLNKKIERVHYWCKHIVDKYYSLKNDEEYMKRYNEYEARTNYKMGGEKYRIPPEEFILRDDDGIGIYFGNIADRYIKLHESIDKINLSIRRRNSKIEKVNEEIEKLKYWNDYVVFEGERYGIPSMLEYIHRENDCFGNISFIKYECDRCGKELLTILINMNNEYD